MGWCGPLKLTVRREELMRWEANVRIAGSRTVFGLTTLFWLVDDNLLGTTARKEGCFLTLIPSNIL